MLFPCQSTDIVESLDRFPRIFLLIFPNFDFAYRYRTRTGWRAHEAYVHTKQLNYRCDEPGCDKAYLCESDLVVHKRKHSGELPFTCSYCGNRYISAHSLAQHEKAAHLQTEVSFYRSNDHYFENVQGVRLPFLQK